MNGFSSSGRHTLVLSCSPRKAGNSDSAAELVGGEFAARRPGLSLSVRRLSDIDIRACTACDYCAAHPGRCSMAGLDETNRLLSALCAPSPELPVSVIVSPIHFYHLPARLKALLDRSQYSWHLPPGEKPGRDAKLAVVLLAAGTNYVVVKDYLRTKIETNIVTSAHDKGEYVLPDGTHIWLNAGSVLRYYGDLTGRRRVVELDGEGFFKVRHDADRPFILQMEDMNIEVLGTEFDVINYAEFATTEAILCNGSIRAYGGRLPAPVTLKPGDRLVFDRKEGRASRSRVSTRNYSQWMGGSLSFDDTSLADILTNLERWYAVEIDAPEAWTRQVRMSFKLIRNESIEEILKAMSLVVEMDYVCAGRRITIIPKQPKNS